MHRDCSTHIYISFKPESYLIFQDQQNISDFTSSQFVKKNQNKEKIIFKLWKFCSSASPVCTCCNKRLQQATQNAKKKIT